MDAPKLFISYSWSTPDHEQWVLDLATELRDSGIDVILDKWDLKEGHDAIAFMEQMVTDKTINKVVMVCDKIYADKADGRNGGVGTETQIISKEVYDNQAQEKFVAIVCEKDEKGKPFLPAYYKSRIYIDLSNPSAYSDNFERLLRWAFNKPLYRKPDIGKIPAFLNADEHILLGTSAHFKRSLDAIKNCKPTSFGAFDECCGIFAANLERFRISNTGSDFDELIIKNIEDFLPYRNEFIALLISIAQYLPTDEFINRIHKFFEEIIPYMDRPEGATSWNKLDFDNYKFIIHELFLYTIAIFIKYERFKEANHFFQQNYYAPTMARYGGNSMSNFTLFRQFMESLSYRNSRLNMRRLSLRADLLKDRSASSGIDFHYLLQADFVAFLRADIETTGEFERWWPETLVWIERYHLPFEMFGKSISKTYFDRMKILLGINSPNDLIPLLDSYENGSKQLPKWEFDSFNPRALLGFKELATRA